MDPVHNTVAEIVYGYGPAAPLCYLRSVTHHFIHDEATMNLILAFSSYAWSSLFGRSDAYEKKGLMYVTKGIQLVNKNLHKSSQSVTESAIQAAIVMSAIEVRFPRSADLFVSLNSANELLRVAQET